MDTTTGISRYGALPDSWWEYDGAPYPSGLIEGGRVAVVSDSRRATAADPSREQPSVGLLPIDVATGDPAGPRQQVPGAKGHDWDDVDDPADRLRISPDGRTLVSVLEGQVRIWHRRGQRWVGPQSVPIPGLARDDADEDGAGRGNIQHSRRSCSGHVHPGGRPRRSGNPPGWSST